ncbi:hypothetical protein IQ07DRAFT_385962 [Pyrenochaeta sp. DS3sAY3a]|nr:hypothetical protein IQ07DRAFT_385962 [Pyrenochaeta sp. DS3sAY3a]
MPLLDLPLEILDLIIDHAPPTGFESFVLSCRTIYGRAGSQIQQHNAMKREWAHTTNASPTCRSDTLGLLYQISCDPHITYYIRSLSLWDHRIEEDISEDPDEYDFRGDEEAMDGIKTLLSSSEFLGDNNVEEWWELIKEKDFERSYDDSLETIDNLYAVVALLSLLPNLRTLQLPDSWHEVRSNENAASLVPVIESLVSLSNSPGLGLKPLAELETIMPFVEEGYDIKVGLQCLQPFMTLKSLRNLYAVSCVAVDDDWAGIPFHWPNPEIKSPLTRIELVSCCMDANALAILLAQTPALTIFRYSHQTKWDGLEHDWNPGEFLETIARYCSDQLLELAITIDELHGEVINGLSSFMRFPNLRKLEVDVEAFCGPPLESGQRLGRNATIPHGAKPWEYVDIPCMGDMLPKGIRELHVNTDFPAPSEQALRALFKNIKVRRLDKLFDLEKVVIRQYRASTAQDVADDHGIVLDVFEEGVANPRPRSMMPEWKRDFDRTVGGIVSADP